jgi:DNA repair protein RadC
MKIQQSEMPEISLKYSTNGTVKTKIKDAMDAHSLFLSLFDPDTLEYKEMAIVLFLNRANHTIGWMKLSEGGTSSTVIDSKIIFATALKCNASAIILSHNHPSGTIEPSNQDIVVTESITKFGNLIDIKLLDHVIITKTSFYSFADNGRI